MAMAGDSNKDSVHTDSEETKAIQMSVKEWSKQFNDNLAHINEDVCQHFVDLIKCSIGDYCDDRDIRQFLEQKDTYFQIASRGPPEEDVTSQSESEANEQLMNFRDLGNLAVLFIMAPPPSRVSREEITRSSAEDMLVDVSNVSMLQKTDTGDKYEVVRLTYKVQNEENFHHRLREFSLILNKLEDKNAALDELSNGALCIVFKVNNTGTFWLKGDQSLYDELEKKLKSLIVTVDDEKRANHYLADQFNDVVAIAEASKAFTNVRKTVKTAVEAEEVAKQFMKEYGVKSKSILVVFFGHGDKKGNLTFQDPVDKMSQIKLINVLLSGRRNFIPRSIDIIWTHCYGYLDADNKQNDERLNLLVRQDTVDMTFKDTRSGADAYLFPITSPLKPQTRFVPFYTDGVCTGAKDVDIQKLITFLKKHSYGEACATGVFTRRFTLGAQENTITPGGAVDLNPPEEQKYPFDNQPKASELDEVEAGFKDFGVGGDED